MKFLHTDHGSVTVIAMDGAILGGPEATGLSEEIHRCIDAKRMHLVVDLSNVTIMNSSGIGSLIAGLTTMRNSGGDLRLAAVCEKVKQLFIITKLHGVFQFFATIEDAVNSYGC
jgi:anti-sigma B factor antagonist